MIVPSKSNSAATRWPVRARRGPARRRLRPTTGFVPELSTVALCCAVGCAMQA